MGQLENYCKRSSSRSVSGPNWHPTFHESHTHIKLKLLFALLLLTFIEVKKLQNYSPRLGTVIFEAFSSRKRDSRRYTTKEKKKNSKKKISKKISKKKIL